MEKICIKNILQYSQPRDAWMTQSAKVSGVMILGSRSQALRWDPCSMEHLLVPLPLTLSCLVLSLHISLFLSLTLK